MMNGLDKLRNAGDGINNHLTEIRKSINAPLGVFPVSLKAIEITGKKLQEFGKKDEPIIIKNEFHLAYVKDHINREFYGTKSDCNREIIENPSSCFTSGNKVHFYLCRTIYNMTKMGKDRKYVATSYFSNTQPIDLDDEKNFETRLALCQNCIGILIEKGKVNIDYSEKMIIVEYGDAQNLMDCVKSLYNNEDDARQETEEFINRTLRKEI